MRMLFDKEIKALRIEAALAGIRGTVNGELKHLWDDITFATKLVDEIEASELHEPTPTCAAPGQTPGHVRKEC